MFIYAVQFVHTDYVAGSAHPFIFLTFFSPFLHIISNHSNTNHKGISTVYIHCWWWWTNSLHLKKVLYMCNQPFKTSAVILIIKYIIGISTKLTTCSRSLSFFNVSFMNILRFWHMYNNNTFNPRLFPLQHHRKF